MSAFAIDIVVPVWNSPLDTRRCIISLADNSPGARLILIDNGSDRETERLLEEFAEILDDRALLLKSDANLGFVKAVNHGLNRGEAPYLAVVRTGSVVQPGWLEPLLAVADQQADVGILLPALSQEGVPKGKPSRSISPLFVEADHASFSAMVLRKKLIDTMGTFDDGMDSATWCLRDLSRRAWRAGFRTVSVSTPPVVWKEEALLGSLQRRRERVEQSMQSYRKRWGDEGDYFLPIPKDAGGSELADNLGVLLEGARQGSRFTLAIPKKLAPVVAQSAGHENITCLTYPMILAAQWVQRAFSKKRADLTVQPVRWCDGVFAEIPGSIPFSALQERVDQGRYQYYSSAG